MCMCLFSCLRISFFCFRRSYRGQQPAPLLPSGPRGQLPLVVRCEYEVFVYICLLTFCMHAYTHIYTHTHIHTHTHTHTHTPTHTHRLNNHRLLVAGQFFLIHNSLKQHPSCSMLVHQISTRRVSAWSHHPFNIVCWEQLEHFQVVTMCSSHKLVVRL